MAANGDVYRSPEIVKWYEMTAARGLTQPEKYCVDVVPVSRRQSILDIGVGGGRTTGPLSEMFKKYVGIDYSDTMIAVAGRLFPDVDLRMMDARNLDFRERFDCVMFSFNGIDAVDYADRQRILRQVANVLSPGGYLIYSTHNLHAQRCGAFLKRLLVRELFKPWPRIRSIARLLVNRVQNFWRQEGDQSRAYAYVNDSSERFCLLTTYVDIGAEAELLAQQGYSVITTIGDTKQTAGYDADDNWVYIVASKQSST